MTVQPVDLAPAPGGPDRSDAGRRGLAVTVTVAALAVAVGAGVPVALGAVHLSHGAHVDGAREQAMSAGAQIAVDFAAYDYRHLDSDFARVAAESTGAFRQEYLTQSAGVKDLIVKAQAVSTAEVAGEGVSDFSTSHATVLIALDRKVVNTKVPNGQTDSFALLIGLVKKGNRWLADQVKPL